MAASQTIHLATQTFQASVEGSWRDLQHQKHFHDVTLACEDYQIGAHKVILSSCSPVLGNLLKKKEFAHQHPLLYLRGVKFSDLKKILNFMYQGEVDTAHEELDTFLAVAQDFKVKGLSEDNMWHVVEEETEQVGHYVKGNESRPMKRKKISTKMKTDKKCGNQLKDPDPLFVQGNPKTINMGQLQDIVKTESIQAAKASLDKIMTDFENQNNVDFQNQNFPDLLNPIENFVEKGEYYKCDKCPYTATRRQYFNDHVDSVHEKKKYYCDYDKCDYQSTWKRSIKRHKVAMHGEKCSERSVSIGFNYRLEDNLHVANEILGN